MSELRSSAKLVAAALVIAAPVLYFVGDNPLIAGRRIVLMDLALVCCGISGAVLILDRWRPELGRWVGVVALTGLVLLVSAWLSLPAALVLMFLPVALAAVMISLKAAATTALIETTLLVALPRPALADSDTVVVALAAIWLTVGVMAVAYRPIYERTEWVRNHYERAQVVLEEVRARKFELEQALARLANANRQLALANERMTALRLMAEDAQKTKTTFVAKVSHEFRTPLNMIIGLVGLMAEHPEIYALDPSPEMEEALEVVLRNCQHLATLIDDVLDLTRVETGRLTLHKERVDLAEIVEEASVAVRPLLQSKGLSLAINLRGDLPAVYCDRTRIRQVVLNLVSNAARFTEQGGITINLTGRVGHVVVEVADTGPGIAPEDAACIFEPFCQGTSNLWRDKGGSGLGLSISQQFVKLHQGRMWLESEPGAGSSFFFELPISPPVERAPAPGRWIRGDWVWREDSFRTDQPQTPEGLPKPRVVVCDDAGGLAAEFGRFEDVIELVRAEGLQGMLDEVQECMANVVVFNASSPGALPALLEEARHQVPTTPVIGCSVPRAAQTALAAGAAGYLVKPVSAEDLRAALSSTRGRAQRVLVVDDDPDAVALFTQMLHLCDPGLQIECALTGEQAMEKLSGHPYELVLLDVVMPGLDGWQVMDRLRATGWARRSAVYFVSAQDPADRPPTAGLLLATVGEGLSIVKLLRCSLELAKIMLTPDGALDPMPLSTDEARRALTESTPHPEPAPVLPL